MHRARLGMRMAPSIVILSILFLASGCTSPTTPPPVQSKEKWEVFLKSPGKLINGHINAIILDHGRNIWLATNDGASSFSAGTWSSVRDSLGYPTGAEQTISHRVSCIVQGKDGSLWFGLSGGGVVRYDPFSSVTVWRHYREPDIAYDVILSAAADVSDQSPYGEVWLTTAFGISRFIGGSNDQGTWVSYTRDNLPQLPSNQVPACINKLDDNSFWFGTQTGGAVAAGYGLTGLEWSRYPLPSDSRINSISFDLHNTLWFGLDEGAASFNVGASRWTVYSPDTAAQKLPAGPVNAVLTDLNKIRWFGTNAGVVRLDDTTWTRFTSENSPLPNDTVNALLYDFHQNLWIGTQNGVAVYNPAGVLF